VTRKERGMEGSECRQNEVMNMKETSSGEGRRGRDQQKVILKN